MLSFWLGSYSGTVYEVGSGSDVGQVTEPAGRAGVYPLGWREGFIVHR